MTEPKFEVIDDYTVKYDGDYFDLHKPSDIRSLVTVANYVVTKNERLKQAIQAIITKEFELSSDDNGYDPLTEFFNNEVNISQIEVDINVEKEEKTYNTSEKNYND